MTGSLNVPTGTRNFRFPERFRVFDGERDSGSGIFDFDPILSKFLQVAADFLIQLFEKLLLPLLLRSTGPENVAFWSNDK